MVIWNLSPTLFSQAYLKSVVLSDLNLAQRQQKLHIQTIRDGRAGFGWLYPYPPTGPFWMRVRSLKQCIYYSINALGMESRRHQAPHLWFCRRPACLGRCYYYDVLAARRLMENMNLQNLISATEPYMFYCLKIIKQ